MKLYYPCPKKVNMLKFHGHYAILDHRKIKKMNSMITFMTIYNLSTSTVSVYIPAIKNFERIKI